MAVGDSPIMSPPEKKQKGQLLGQLRKICPLVIDSAHPESAHKFPVHAATTNPTLMWQLIHDHMNSAQRDKQIHDWIYDHKFPSLPLDIAARSHEACLRSIVQAGAKLVECLEGPISTQLPPALAFDTTGLVDCAHRIIHLYALKGINSSRILLKLPGTWEGIQAAKLLELEKLHCNITLIFSEWQAIAAADAEAYVISPFVGRMKAYYQKMYPNQDFSKTQNHPGVQLTKKIRQIYNQLPNCKTQILSASIRDPDEAIALVKISDLMTIGTSVLNKISDLPEQSLDELSLQRNQEKFSDGEMKPVLNLTESAFRWHLNQQEEASALLIQGINLFQNDWLRLENFLKDAIAGSSK